MRGNPSRWYLSDDELANSPSRRDGMDAGKELNCRQQTAQLIQEMGQRLSVSQLAINTAITYMHRFYVVHSLKAFHRNEIAAASLFLAAKVEEQPRKLEHVVRVLYATMHKEDPNLNPKSDAYTKMARELVDNEQILLQTLGFEVAIDHPHTYVVRCTQMVRARASFEASEEGSMSEIVREWARKCDGCTEFHLVHRSLRSYS